MTRHLCVRPISSLLLLAAVLFQLPTPAIAQSAAPTSATPTLAERLDRLATEFDRSRIDLHVPGAVLAIVRGEEVIFARGYIESAEFLGRAIYHVERVEVGVELAPDTFTLGSLTTSSGGR
jgi:CubicO group peptidase (beta-lactamase class C family)